MESHKNYELYGLKSLFKFKPLKLGDNKLFDNDSSKKMIFDNTDILKKSSIIKIDFTTSNAFILFSDGELYSKGWGSEILRECISAHTGDCPLFFHRTAPGCRCSRGTSCRV